MTEDRQDSVRLGLQRGRETPPVDLLRRDDPVVLALREHKDGRKLLARLRECDEAARARASGAGGARPVVRPCRSPFCPSCNGARISRLVALAQEAPPTALPLRMIHSVVVGVPSFETHVVHMSAEKHHVLSVYHPAITAAELARATGEARAELETLARENSLSLLAVIGLDVLDKRALLAQPDRLELARRLLGSEISGGADATAEPGPLPHFAFVTSQALVSPGPGGVGALRDKLNTLSDGEHRTWLGSFASLTRDGDAADWLADACLPPVSPTIDINVRFDVVMGLSGPDVDAETLVVALTPEVTQAR